MQPVSIWSLVAEASFIVQLVMLALLALSIVSWAMIMYRAKVMNQCGQGLVAFEDEFWSGIDINHLYTDLDRKSVVQTGIVNIFCASFREYLRLEKKDGLESKVFMQSIQRVMRVAISRENDELTKHLSFLASAGSVSPYIGLFGTVWGIMNAFLGLAASGNASLASVAPGIAEALIATAMGIFVAIPAVVAYNHYSTRAEELLSAYEIFAEEFTGILHRRLY